MAGLMERQVETFIGLADLATICGTSGSLVLAHAIFWNGLGAIRRVSTTYWNSNSFLEKALRFARVEAVLGALLLILGAGLSLRSPSDPTAGIVVPTGLPYWLTGCLLILLVYLATIVPTELFEQRRFRREYRTARKERALNILESYAYQLHNDGYRKKEERGTLSEEEQLNRVSNALDGLKGLEELLGLGSRGTIDLRLQRVRSLLESGRRIR